ncbi:MAG: hypothetical protein WBQ14_05725 [Gaiellaceae bacterium]
MPGETAVVPEAPVESQFQPVEGADEMLDMPLGTLIFRAGLIAPQQLEDALAEGLRSGKRLGEVLLSRGWLSEDDLSRLLAGQKGLPYADLEKIAVDRELAQAMSYEDARSEMALPVVTEFGLPVVAMADPDEAAMDRLRAQLGPEVRFVVGAPSVLTRLIDEVLGGAPAPGLLVAPTVREQYTPTEASALDQYAQDEPGAADQIAAAEQPAATEPIPAETDAEPEPVSLETVAPDEAAAEPEPVALDSSEQEVSEPAPAPEPAEQEVRPIIVEGEVEYPTFSEFQPIPEIEIITSSDEQLPPEVQMGGFGYYDDASLLEGNAWQAGETGPRAAEPVEPVDLAADPLDQPVEQAEAPTEYVDQAVEQAEAPTEYVEQPVEQAEAPSEYAEQPSEYAEQPSEYVEQPSEYVEAPAEQAWEEPYPEAASEPVAGEFEEPELAQAPDPAEEVAGPAEEEEIPALTTPAWMRGEVNVITADVADFIDSGASDSPVPAADGSGDVVESEPAPVVGEYEIPVEAAPPPEDEAEAVELAQDEPAEADLAPEPPSWASEPVEASEEVATEGFVLEDAGDISPEPAATSENESAPAPNRGEFELVLRLVDGDRMPIGSFSSVEGAQEKAAEVVKQFGETKDGSWPLIGGRFLRPDTIVSIDIEEHGSGWGGSNSRGRMFSGDSGA